MALKAGKPALWAYSMLGEAMGLNMYYRTVRDFLTEYREDFDELRKFTGLSVGDQLVEVLKTGLRDELVTKEILEQDAKENSTIDEGSTIDGGEADD